MQIEHQGLHFLLPQHPLQSGQGQGRFPAIVAMTASSSLKKGGKYAVKINPCYRLEKRNALRATPTKQKRSGISNYEV